ncbi:MAG TPA: HTTM domain-containing protein [Lacipirellulaceae bacterium]|nr:HTTM domain-containing protein [Lacipirellulaceae bacterium]
MIAAVREYFSDVWQSWDWFWFSPTSPSTLSAIRVLAGAMLLYTTLVWSFDLNGFFGPNGFLPPNLMHEVHAGFDDPDGPGPAQGKPGFMWSHFDYVQSPKLIWSLHIVALGVFFCLTIGFFSRTMAVAAFLFAVSYANRVTPGAFFGLDKINCMLALYLMLGPCGARYSVDRLWRLKRGITEVAASSGANFAIRLIQVHMCIIYLFSGIGKLQGLPWANGQASWLSFDMLEYRSRAPFLDMTWMAGHPYMLNFMTHATVFWELSYCALIWPALTRPWVLAMAVLVHGGIALFLGMPTFGLVMLIGNLAFVSPKTVRKVFDPVARRLSLAFVGKATKVAAAE